MAQTVLDPEYNMENISYDINEDPVRAALQVIEDNNEAKEEQDTINYHIQQLFEEGFEVSDPSGTRKIGSQVLQQALWRTQQRIKPLDFTVNGQGRPRPVEKVVTSGIATVLQDGGYIRALRDKEGAFQKLLLYGDAFIHVGANPSKKGAPIVFRTISNSNIYTDTFATGIRIGKNSGKNTTKLVAIFSYSWAEAIRLYPELEKKGTRGRIPREMTTLKELERSYEQEIYDQDDVTEIAFSYDIANKDYCVFGGRACTMLEHKSGDDYPYMLDDEPYIPVSQFICMYGASGFYNYGIGTMLYKLAIITRRLMNMAIGHVEENTYPIELISVPQGEASKFFNKVQMAYKLREKGKRGFVAMEYDPTDPAGGQVQTQTLLSQSLFNEWQIMFDRLAGEIRRLGINIDEQNISSNPTATEILSQEENANAFVKQIMENNASETKFLVELTMNMIETFVKKNDKTPLNITSPVTIDGQTIRPDFVTLGLVADELKQNHYYVSVNSRSGAIPSQVMRRAQLLDVLQITPPGTPAFFKATQELAQINEQEFTLEDFGFQPQPPPGAQPEQPEQAAQGGGAPEELETQNQTQTDRLSINPQTSQVPAL